jgi:hypothetical protein
MTFDTTTAPLFVLLAAVLLIVLLRVARAFQSGTFDATLLPHFLDGYVLGNLVPLALLGLAVPAYEAAYPEPRDVVQWLGWGVLGAAYVAGLVAAAVGYVVRITELVNGQAGFLNEIEEPTEGPDKE